jgi:hypothetical protein
VIRCIKQRRKKARAGRRPIYVIDGRTGGGSPFKTYIGRRTVYVIDGARKETRKRKEGVHWPQVDSR